MSINMWHELHGWGFRQGQGLRAADAPVCPRNPPTTPPHRHARTTRADAALSLELPMTLALPAATALPSATDQRGRTLADLRISVTDAATSAAPDRGNGGRARTRIPQPGKRALPDSAHAARPARLRLVHGAAPSRAPSRTSSPVTASRSVLRGCRVGGLVPLGEFRKQAR
jgi:hypothetical protein